MENAAKALLIAGSVLLGIIVLSIFMIMVNSLTDYQQAQTQIEKNQDIVAFNNQFQGYMRSDLAGTDILSLINKVTYYNKAKASDAIGADDAGNQYVYEPITLVVDLDGKQLEFSMSKTKNELFADNRYEFNGTVNMDKTFEIINNLLNKTKMPTPPQNAIPMGTGVDVSLPEQYTKERTIYYTKGILKGLIENYNSVNSIFDSAYIGVNDSDSIMEKRKRFIEFNRIVGTTYFPLNYRNGNSLIEGQYKNWWNDYFGSGLGVKKSSVKINGSTKNLTIREVLALYYEYTQFERGKFEFVQPGAGQETYSSNTGRVKYMEFKFTGEFI